MTHTKSKKDKYDKLNRMWEKMGEIIFDHDEPTYGDCGMYGMSDEGMRLLKKEFFKSLKQNEIQTRKEVVEEIRKYQREYFVRKDKHGSYCLPGFEEIDDLLDILNKI